VEVALVCGSFGFLGGYFKWETRDRRQGRAMQEIVGGGAFGRASGRGKGGRKEGATNN
jgi:hypothetical protein